MKKRPVLFALALCACSGHKSSGPVTVKLDKLGLQIVMPFEPTIKDDGMLGGPHDLPGKGVVLHTRDHAWDDLNVAIDTKAWTIDEVKGTIAINKPRDVQVEQLSDGFAVTYATTTPYGERFGFQVERVIDGHQTECTTLAASVDVRTKLLTACKSLAR